MNAQRISSGLFVLLAMLDAGCSDPGPVLLTADLGTSIDAGRDLGSRDSAVDLGERLSDAGGGCFVGDPCDSTRGCRAGLACERAIGLYFPRGYCTNATIDSASSREGAPDACDPTPSDETPGMDGCPGCAKCNTLGAGPDGINIVQCRLRCAPAAVTNPCRDGYTCQFGTEVCVDGCHSDEECQGYLGGAAGCATTGRCAHPGTAGISAGATCVLDSECEMDGRCLSERSFPDWIGGYCTKFGCDVLGCAGIGKCLDVGGGTNICTSPCKLADDPGDAELGAVGGDDDCRTGYACFWDGVSAPTDAVNGGCLAGNYNAITVPNIGASCVDPDGPTGSATSDDECWSPYGLGRCVFEDASASCSILGCTMLPTGACGTGSSCVSLSTASSMCLRDCATAADCNADGGPSSYGCVDATGMGGGTKHCFPGCRADADCDALYRCTGGSGTALGECIRR